MGKATDRLLGKSTSKDSSLPTAKGSAVQRLLAGKATPEIQRPSVINPALTAFGTNTLKAQGIAQQAYNKDKAEKQKNLPRVSVMDVVRELPGASRKVRSGAENFLIGNTKKLVSTTGNILGEAAAYTFDKNTREQALKNPEAFRTIFPTAAKTRYRDVAGMTLGSAAELASFAKGAKVVQAATKAPGITKLATEGAKAGAKYGTAFGVSSGLQSDKTPTQVALEGVAGGATGAVAGGLLSGLIGGISKAATKYRASRPVTPQVAQDAGVYAGGVTLPKPGKKPVAEKTITVYRSVGRGAETTGEKGVLYVTPKKSVAGGYDAATGGSGLAQTKITLDRAKVLDISKYQDELAYITKAQKAMGAKGAGNTDKLINDFARSEGYDAVNRGAENGIAILNPSAVTPKSIQQTSRVNQSIAREAQARIETSPQYTQRLNELGGGKVKSNPETLNAGLKLVDDGTVTVDSIASHRAGTPINEDTVAAAAIIKDHYEQRWLEAMNKGDGKAADEANAILQKMAPGYNNLTATPGRATQIQSQFGEDKLSALYKRMRELQDKRVPFKAVQKEMNNELKTLRKAEQQGKLFERATNTIRALENYATGAKLTSPITHLVNTVSNALTFVERGAERYVKAGVQLAQGRPQDAAATAKYAFGTGMGVRSGFRKFLNTLVEDAPEYGLKAEVNATQKASTSPKAFRVFNPFRWLSAADGFWKSIIQDSELHTKAFAAAKTEGLTGKALAKKVTELVNNPPTQWVDDASKVAQEYTFQMEPDKFLKAVSKIRNVPGGRFVIPFIQTPYNIVKFQAQRSVLGALSRRNIGDIAKGGDAAAEAIARLSIGAGLSMGAWQLVQHGEVTGAYPQDTGERAVWEAEGRKPYSIKIGNKWFAYNRFQPVGLYLTQAAALDESIKAGNEEGAAAAFSTMLAYTAKAISDLPFVSGMAGVINAIEDPENYASKALSSTLTGFIPNILRDVRAQTDSTQREARGTLKSAQNMIPGLSQGLEPKVDVLGREKTYDISRWARASKVLSTIKSTKESDTLREAGYPVSELNRAAQTLKRDQKSYKLTDSEFTQFKKDMGAATLQAITEAPSTPGWKEMDQDKKNEILSGLITKKRNSVRDSWKSKKL